MPKLEEAKERVGILKFWLAIAVGAFMALSAWMAQNYIKQPRVFCFLVLV